MAAVLFAAGCSYDDSGLQDRVGALEEKVKVLEQTVNQMNSNLKALQATVDVLNSGDYIKEVTPVTAGDEVVGYTITFGKGEPITIYHGENGTNGKTPAISVTVGADGKYYWTVNGEILKDASGNDVSAAGVAPLLRVNNGVWQYSIDNGATWTDVTVEGYGGVIFKDVIVGESSVKIELADGTVFEIPKLMEFALEFDKTSYYVANEVEFTLGYTIKGADEATQIMVFAGDDITVALTKEDYSKGTIKIVKGTETKSVQIMVLASNGKGQKDYEIINFNELEFTASAVDVAFEAGAGSSTVQMTSNVELTVKTSEAVDWLTYELTVAEDGSNVLSINATENPFRMIRSVVLSIVDEYGYVIEEITVAQAAADYQTAGQMGDIGILPA